MGTITRHFIFCSERAVSAQPFFSFSKSEFVSLASSVNEPSYYLQIRIDFDFNSSHFFNQYTQGYKKPWQPAHKTSSDNGQRTVKRQSTIRSMSNLERFTHILQWVTTLNAMM